MNHAITTATLLLSLAAVSVPSLAEADTTAAPQPVVVPDYTVYLDLPTGFTFIKMPQGWVFAGKSERAVNAPLPSNVVTNLLAPEPQVLAASRNVNIGAKGKLGGARM